MGDTHDEYTLGERPVLGRTVPEQKEQPEPEGPFLTWSDDYAERETLKRPVSPEEMKLAGRYKVLRRLGEGGMGSVWLAEDLKLDGRRVAVKMLPAVLAGKKTAYRQVKQEALMAMKLVHSNIATVRAFEEEEGGAPFLVMDYIEGTGLDDILAEKGKLSEAETLELLGPVAAALDYAHGKGVVHRDVKPGNVMVAKDGTPFVLDFGIAREIQETMTRVTGKFSSGTLMYMSPEQLHGRAPKAAQDVYSFAAMAYECLAGAPPFSRGQLEYQIDHDMPEPLVEGVGSAALREGIMAGLAKEPGERPGSCVEVLGNGRASRPGEPEEGTPAGITARPEGSPHQGASESERAMREAEACVEAERAARRAAEENAAKAREEARARALEAMQAKEARGHASRLAWALVLVLIGAGVAGGVWWYNDHQEILRSGQSSQDRLAALEQEQAGWADKVQQAEDAARAERTEREKLEKQRADAVKEVADARQQMDDQRVELERQWNLREEALKAEEAAKREAAVKAAVKEALKRQREEDERRREKSVQQTQPAVAATPATAGPRTAGGRRAGETKTIRLPGGATMEMVWCPPDTFTMGSPPNEADREDNETQHRVTLTEGFWMAKTEVTQKQWQSVMGTTVEQQRDKVDRSGLMLGEGDNYPMYYVNWNEAREFCRKCRDAGIALRLPTEAEWEYACRAGSTGAYAGTGNLATMGWYAGYSGGTTYEVGRKGKNAWGLYDMHGNVWEWCEDSYQYELGSQAVTNPVVDGGVSRVLRGGSWDDNAKYCRSAARNYVDPYWRGRNYGFRPCWSAGLP